MTAGAVPTIAYYVHHQGSGHRHRAAAIAAQLRSAVVGLGTGPTPADWPGRWVELPADTDGTDDTAGTVEDPTAHGTLHWTPRRHPGLRARMQLISAALTGAALLVVDVSVEVAVLGRLHGVPVVVMAQPGDRTDRPHRLAYDLADRLLAPWPARAAPGWSPEWTAKTVHLGGLSRFDGRSTRPPDARRVLALWGSGGLDIGAAAMHGAAAATPDWRWDVIGPPAAAAGPANLTWRGWVGDVWPELDAAGVVVTHAGQNALAEVAAARRAAVIVPQRRPHDEQQATGEALHRAGLGVVAPTWPAAAMWPGVLQEAADRGGAAWKAWSPGDAAARAAALLDGMACP